MPERDISWEPIIVGSATTEGDMQAAVRLYRPEPTQEQPQSPQESCLAMWQRIVLPELRAMQRASDTIDEQRRAIERFERWLSENDFRMPYPEVSTAHLRGWRDSMAAEKLSPATVNKFVGCVCGLLRAAEREQVIQRAPAPPRRLANPGRSAPRVFGYVTDAADQPQDQDQLSAVYRAAGDATWPRRTPDGKDLDPVAQWRALWVVGATYGIRLGDMIQHKAKHTPLRWDSVLWEPKSPSSDVVSEHGWIRLEPLKTRRLGKRLLLPLTEAAARHLRSLPQISERVFPWPCASKSFRDQWARLMSAAGVAGLTPHCMRSTCHTWWEHLSGSEIADAVTGHAARGVGRRHYTNSERALVEACRKLPTPAAWAAQQHQRLLF